MSTLKSIFLGTFAVWVQIGTGIVVQLAFTTVALTWWTVEDFGLWLALMVVPTFFTIPDNALQTYMQGEFLKHGKGEPNELSKLMSDAAVIAITLGLIEFLIVLVLVYFEVFAKICGIEPNDSRVTACNLFVIGNAIIWLFLGASSGLYSKALVAVGYFTRIAWWGTVSVLVVSLAPILIVLVGGDILRVVIVYLIVRAIFSIGFLLDCIQLSRTENIFFTRPQLLNSLRYWLKSLILVTEMLSEQFRQQGIRFLLAIFSGSAGVASFVTTRSGANLALQALNIVGYPVVPQLMRYIRDQDQIRLEGMIGWLYLFTLAIFFPMIICIQVFLPNVFPIWTRGKIDFDPALCGALLTSLIIFSCAQPAIVIVRSNNLLLPQLFISILVGVSTIGSFYVMIDYFGANAAAYSLLIADLIASSIYVVIASRFLPTRGLRWPWKTFLWFMLGAVAIIGLLISIIIRNDYFPATALILVSTWIISIHQFAKSLPQLVHDKLKSSRVFSILGI